jgi:lysophospholipase L1-like esterase
MTLRPLALLPLLFAAACSEGGDGSDTDATGDTDPGAVTNPDPDVNSYIPSGYRPTAPVRLVFLGDSITAGSGASKTSLQYTSLLQENEGSRWQGYNKEDLESMFGNIDEVIDVSVGGATTATMKSQQIPALKQQLGTLPAQGETIIVFTIGGNDAQGALNPFANAQQVINSAFKNFDAMIDTLTDPTVFAETPHIYATNIYEPSGGVGKSSCFMGIDYSDKLPVLDDYNARLAELGQERGFAVVDLHGQFLDHNVNAEDPSNPNYDADDATNWFYDDCIHPNDRGHHELRRLFVAAIDGAQVEQDIPKN